MIFHQTAIARHERRAAEWEAAGKPDYAEGSRKKAARWRRKERELDMLMHGPLPNTRIAMLLARHIEAISASITADFEAALLHG